jgi:glycosidase
VLFYGEEIGMGEDLSAEGRYAVRTAMQWSDDRNGGFSTADASELAAPVVQGDFGPAAVNVAAQRRDPNSLLSWITLLIRRYRECPELAWGKCTVLEHEAPAVFALRADAAGGTVLALHNLDRQPAEVTAQLDDVDSGTRVVDLLVDDTTTLGDDHSVRLRLDGYGCRWLRVGGPSDDALA